jgi:hypothetical protein
MVDALMEVNGKMVTQEEMDAESKAKQNRALTEENARVKEIASAKAAAAAKKQAALDQFDADAKAGKKYKMEGQ